MPSNKIFKGDLFKTLKKVEDKSIDLVIADPPYNISIDKWDTFKTKENYFEFMEKWIFEVEKKMKNNSSIFIYNNEYNSALTIPILESLGFNFQNWITWVKRDGFVTAKKRFVNAQEVILFFTKGNPDFNYEEVRTEYLSSERMKHAAEKGILKDGKRWYPNPNGKLRTNVWEEKSHRQTNKIAGKIQKADHPTIKPLQQIEVIVKSASKEGRKAKEARETIRVYVIQYTRKKIMENKDNEKENKRKEDRKEGRKTKKGWNLTSRNTLHWKK